jgi:hypothetical protein
MYKKELVVSHFEKDLTWIDNVNSDCKVVIYTKNQDSLDFIKLPNIGREPHTYLHHIVTNYGDLCDWTIFSQDNNTDHVQDWVNIINQEESYWKEKAAISAQGAYYFCDYGTYQEYGENGGGYPMGDVWKTIFGTPFPGIITFAPACNFIISKNLIHGRSLDFYLKLKLILEQVPLAPWIFERYFTYIFNLNIN